MFLLSLYVALLFLLGIPIAETQDDAPSTIHVQITTLITITSCHPTVTGCTHHGNLPPSSWDQSYSQAYPVSPAMSTPDMPPSSDSVPPIASSQEPISSSQSGSLVPMPPFSFTSTGFDRGTSFTTIIQVTPTEPWESGTREAASTIVPVPHTTTVASKSAPQISATGESFSVTSNFTDGKGRLTTTVFQTTVVQSTEEGQSSSVPESLQSDTPVSPLPFTSTSVFTDAQGLPVTGIIVGFFTPSSSILPSPPTAQSSIGNLDSSVQVSPTVVPAISVSTALSSGQIFSFTSVFTDSQGIPTTNILQGTFTPFPTVSPPIQGPQPSTGLSQSSDGPIQSFSTITFTDAQGQLTTSTIGFTATSQSPVPVQSFSFTSTITDAQGQLTTTVIQVTLSTLRSGAQPTSGSSQPPAPLESFTSVFTDSEGNPVTTTILVSQSTQSVEPTPVPSQPSVSETTPPSAPVQSFSFTTTFTDYQGQTVTSVVPGQLTSSLPSAADPISTISGGLPTITPPPTGTLAAHPCEPFHNCLVTATDSTSLSLCSPFPECVYPLVTAKPTICSPFPGCLTTALPSGVQTELSNLCEGTPLYECIFTKPNPVCTKFPDCLVDSTDIDPDICPGLPFPDCLFTLYEPEPTSTLTTLPPGVTIKTSSRDDLTTNTYISTTDRDGHLIFIPVIARCPGCTNMIQVIEGVEGFFNTIFKFPPLPPVQFPKFPKIPKFHIPCIFFCKKGHPHHKPKPPVFDEANEENKESSTTSTTSTSSSSCRTGTVSSCTVYSTISVNGTRTTTMTSTSCSRETKCSATGQTTTTATSSTATATLGYYWIWPKDGVSQTVQDTFTQKLRAETDPKGFSVQVSSYNGTVGFWSAGLNTTQVEDYSKDPAVDWLAPREPKGKSPSPRYGDRKPFDIKGADLDSTQKNQTQKRAPGDVIHQFVTSPQLVDMKVWSQPPGMSLDQISSYSYQEEIPGKARVYILDSGAMAGHDAYTQLNPEPDWLWPGDASGLTHPTDPYDYVDGEKSDWEGHGTAMLSKVKGHTFGISKGAAITIVRVPRTSEPVVKPDDWEPDFSYAAMMHALELIHADVEAKKLQTLAVVSFSISFIPDYNLRLPQPGEKDYGFYQAMEKLTDSGIVFVTSSGNDAIHYGSRALVGIPSIWSAALPLIVVSSCDNYGNVPNWAQYSQAPGFAYTKATVFAPGVEIVNAATDGPSSWTIDIGTSISGASVAGLIANFLSSDKHRLQISAIANSMGSGGHLWPEAVKRYLVEQRSYKRSTGAFANVVYNGELPYLAAPIVYFIAPRLELDASVINAFTEKLKVETNPETLFVSGGTLFTGYWTQYLTPAQVEAYVREPAVLSIQPLSEIDSHFVEPAEQPEASIQRRANNETFATEIFTQKRAPGAKQQKTDELSLKIISQPQGVLLDTIGTYAYQEEEAGAARVYVFDSGFDSQHPLYKQLTDTIGEPDWIWAGNANGPKQADPYNWDNSKTDSDGFAQHGTGMASRVVGPRLGVSKKAALTIVKLPQAIPTQEEIRNDRLTGNSFPHSYYRLSTIHDAVNRIMDDILKNKSERKSVINISLSFRSPETTLPAPGDFSYPFFSSLTALSSHGCMIVVAAGNINDKKDANGNPLDVIQNDLVKWATYSGMAVVGSVDNNGNPWGTQFRPAPGFPNSGVDVWAPGVGMTFANGIDMDKEYVKTDGTSGATAMVSGLIAYFLGVKSHRDKIEAIVAGVNNPNPFTWNKCVINYLQQLSHKRRSTSTVKVVYNGEVPLNYVGNPVCQVPTNGKRQAGDSCAPPDPEASSSLASESSTSMASASSARQASRLSEISASYTKSAASWIASLSSVESVQSQASEASRLSEISVSYTKSAASWIASLSSVESVRSQASEASKISEISASYSKGVASLSRVASLESAVSQASKMSEISVSYSKGVASLSSMASLESQASKMSEISASYSKGVASLSSVASLESEASKMSEISASYSRGAASLSSVASGESAASRLSEISASYTKSAASWIASLSSVASASSAAAASKTATIPGPTATDSYSGYLGSTCIQDNSPPLVQADAAKTALDFCARSWTWDTRGQPPRDTKDSLGAMLQTETTNNGIKTLGQITPAESLGSACASGTYPRSLTMEECRTAYSRLLQECPKGGLLSWRTRDLKGCMTFFMNQSPTNPPPPVEAPPPTTTAAPPPPPQATFLVTVAERHCFKKNEFADEMIINFRLVDGAVKRFCSQTYTWEEFNKPANGEPGTDAHVARKTSPGEFTLDLTAVPSPWIQGEAPELCNNHMYPRVLEPDVCSYGFIHALNLMDCPYGGLAIVTTPTGCVVFGMGQTEN